jgi:hypothetical protein
VVLSPFALSLKGTQSIAGGNAPGKLATVPDPERVEVSTNSKTVTTHGTPEIAMITPYLALVHTGKQPQFEQQCPTFMSGPFSSVW